MQEERDRDDEIGDQELQALKPVALAVLRREIGDEDGKDDGDDFEHIEDEAHLLFEEEAEQDEKGGHEHRDLRG